MKRTRYPALSAFISIDNVGGVFLENYIMEEVNVVIAYTTGCQPVTWLR